jgi:hypothetical protein
VVSILICLVALAQAVLAASYWYTYEVVKDYVEGPVKDPDRLDRADQFWVLALEGLLLVLLAAGVVFIVWLPSSLKSVRTVPATHCGERSLSRPGHGAVSRPERHGDAPLVRSRTWCSCWMIQGCFGNRPSESYLRTTGWVTAEAAAA